MNKPNYDRTGILFRQEDKETEQHPDYTGNITFNNVEYELAGWLQQGKKVKFLKLKVSEKRRKDVSGEIPDAGSARHSQSAKTRPSTGQAPVTADQFDDEIPF